LRLFHLAEVSFISLRSRTWERVAEIGYGGDPARKRLRRGWVTSFEKHQAYGGIRALTVGTGTGQDTAELMAQLHRTQTSDHYYRLKAVVQQGLNSVTRKSIG
jgi:hypothetical protein